MQSTETKETYEDERFKEFLSGKKYNNLNDLKFLPVVSNEQERYKLIGISNDLTRLVIDLCKGRSNKNNADRITRVLNAIIEMTIFSRLNYWQMLT